MTSTENRIYYGKPTAFLVYDSSIAQFNAPFIKWLCKEGFTPGDHHGNFGCPWVHINISRKLYAYGLPGVMMVAPLGNHAITIEEFQTIYSIYKKYEEKQLFAFH